jgi:hypothetical protein
MKNRDSGFASAAVIQHLHDQREQIKKLGGSFDFVTLALNAAEEDKLYAAGAYITAEEYPFSKALVQTGSLQLLCMWLEMLTTNHPVDEETKGLFFLGHMPASRWRQRF